MTPTYSQGWTSRQRTIWWLFTACFTALTVSFLGMLIYELRATGRVNPHPLVHAGICAVAAFAFFQIRRHPDTIANYEARIRALFRR